MFRIVEEGLKEAAQLALRDARDLNRVTTDEWHTAEETTKNTMRELAAAEDRWAEHESARHEKGSHNNIFNIPLPAGTNSNEYFDAYEHVLKKLNQFKPEFIFFSAGFDAHKDDPLSNINLKSQDYFEITKRTLVTSRDYCKGNIVSILEGGYDLNALAESTEEHIKALIEY